MHEYQLQKKHQKEMETAFAAEANKGAEEKERKEKFDLLQKQRVYADELMSEMRKKKEQREVQKNQLIKESEDHLKLIDEA